MKTVWVEIDGAVRSVFLDFARYWGFTPRPCRPYRAQIKGKVESGVKYVRRNFVCGLQGSEPSGQCATARPGMGSGESTRTRHHA
jgi:transposase